MLAVDHFFPPSNPALPSARDKKSFLQCQYADLGVQCFDIDSWACRFCLRFITENGCRSLKELVFLLFDFVGMHVKLLGRFHQRLLASDSGRGHFALKAGLWFQRGRLVMVSPVPGI